MANGRSIQDIFRVLGKKIMSNMQILLEEFQKILMGIDTGENSIMWKITLKRLPKLLGPLDFFVGDCKKILPWVAPCEVNQLSELPLLGKDIHGPLFSSSFARFPYQNI